MDFEILYRLYFRDVYRYVRGLSRDEHLAEEIAQETFARALGAVDRIIGNRFGLGEKFEEGIIAMGSLALSMIGIICLAPVLAGLLRPVVVPLLSLIHI